MRKALLLAALALATFAAVGLTARSLAADCGWWIVLGSIATPNDDFNDTTLQAARRIEAAAGDCGVKVFWDFSSKFINFSAGYTVVVAEEAFSAKDRAERLLAKVTPCVPGAYIRQGRYAGE